MGFRSSRLSLAVVLLGLGLPFAAHAAAAPSANASAAPAAAPGVLTLYSEAGLKGRHATYKRTSLDVEREGFVARSAASIGMWTLCEGGQVASRCQTVYGQAPELKLEPQIVRPGLNALALYDQPGFKGHSIIYSFPADRPAPFHARSARTWGGAWSLCDRGYKDCQSIEGRSQNLDLVVAAVRPEPEAAIAQTPVVLAATAPAVAKAAVGKTPMLTPVAAKPARKTASPSSRPAGSLAPAAALPRAPRLVHVAEPLKKAAKARPARLTHAALEHSKSTRTVAVRVRETHVRAAHPPRRNLYLEVRERLHAWHETIQRRLHPVRVERHEAASRHASHVRLVRISERHGRHAHAARRRLYHRVRLFWGGSDPYLYAGDPRVWGPPPRW